jgi:AcrR family transcriptional regulator
MTKKPKHVDIQALEKPTDRAQAVLDAARSIFISEGVQGLSVRRVAQAAGCTTMVVYSRFNGKNGILEALYDEGFEQLALAQRSIDPHLVGVDLILAYCRAYRATAINYPHHYALMLGQFSDAQVPSKQSQSKAIATLERLTDAVATLPSMRQKKRALSADIANRLFAFSHGWVSVERLGFLGNEKHLDKQFKAAIVALTLDI